MIGADADLTDFNLNIIIGLAVVEEEFIDGIWEAKSTVNLIVIEDRGRRAVRELPTSDSSAKEMTEMGTPSTSDISLSAIKTEQSDFIRSEILMFSIRVSASVCNAHDQIHSSCYLFFHSTYQRKWTITKTSSKNNERNTHAQALSTTQKSTNSSL